MGNYVVLSPLQYKKKIYKDNETIELEVDFAKMLESQGLVMPLPETIQKPKESEKIKDKK